MTTRTLLTVAAILAGLGTSATANAQTAWSSAGADLKNSHATISNNGVNGGSRIEIGTAGQLAYKWYRPTKGNVTATPSVDATGVYVVDNSGQVSKLALATGYVQWSHYLSDYTGVYGQSRTTPAMGSRNEIIIGAQTPSGGRIYSIDKTSGETNWVTTVDNDLNTHVTSSPIIYNGRVYVGIASQQEVASSIKGGTPNFRGKVLSLNEATGAVVWTFYTVPNGYTGGSVWGSTMVVDTARNNLIFGTGNNYSIPQNISQCLKNSPTNYGCIDPSDYVDSVVALNLYSGYPAWSRHEVASDTWNTACAGDTYGTCPTPAGRDTDFASGPNLMWVNNFNGVRDDRGGYSSGTLLGAGQKSGIYHGLNPANGGKFWDVYTGPEAILWGSTVDISTGTYIFTAQENKGHERYTLSGSNQSSTGGSVLAINAASGKIAWQVPSYGNDITNSSVPSSSPGSLSSDNEVVFTGSTSGYLTALNMFNGRLLWKFNTGGVIADGPAIYNDVVYIGTGYNSTNNMGIYAFSINGH